MKTKSTPALRGGVAIACLVSTAVLGGCGVRRQGPPPTPVSVPSVTQNTARPAGETLSAYIAKVRALAAEARPVQRPEIAQLETTDGRLAAALAPSSRSPVDALRRVAYEYQRLGVWDRAHEYLQAALALDRRDGATYDALARLWRDGGLPAVALADAYRAVYFAPQSAVTHNTLGTVFQALGRREEARRQYARARDLDPQAPYALNNLCYAWIVAGDAGEAVAACERAVQSAPDLRAAQNNLALAYALAGDMRAAGEAFDGASDRAGALYNLGMVHLAQRRYPDAVSAFAAAHQARPTWHLARARAAQASRLMAQR